MLNRRRSRGGGDRGSRVIRASWGGDGAVVVADVAEPRRSVPDLNLGHHLAVFSQRHLTRRRQLQPAISPQVRRRQQSILAPAVQRGPADGQPAGGFAEGGCTHAAQSAETETEQPSNLNTYRPS